MVQYHTPVQQHTYRRQRSPVIQVLHCQRQLLECVRQMKHGVMQTLHAKEMVNYLYYYAIKNSIPQETCATSFFYVAPTIKYFLTTM